MYGYIRQGRRTALTRELIGGVAFQVLTVGTGPLRRVRARRLLRRLARQGVSAAVFEDGAWREAAARYGIRPVPVGPLRLAKLGELLDAVCPVLSGKTARLCTGEDGSTARRAARVLVKRARYVAAEPPGQAALEQWLLARYGVAAGCGGQMGAIANSCGIGDFPRLTGGGKLTIMQRDILCVFCLFRGILPIERNVQHGERIQNESGPL